MLSHNDALTCLCENVAAMQEDLRRRQNFNI